MVAVRTMWIAVAVLGVALGSAQAAPVGLKGAGADADKWLMDNADFVVVVNVKQFTSSDLVSKGTTVKEWRDAILKAEPKTAAVFEAAGIDPLKDVDSILFSGSVGTKGTDAKGVIVIRGRFDPDKTFAAIKNKSEKVEVSKENGVTLMKMKVLDHEAFGTFVDKNTLVITQSKESTAFWAKNGGKNESKITPALKATLGKFKGTETLVVAMVPTDDVRKLVSRVPQLAVAGSKLQTVTATLNVTNEVSFQLTAGTADAKSAKQVQSAMNVLKGLGEVMVSEEEYGAVLGTVFSEGKVVIDGTEVRLTLKADKSMMEKATKKKTSTEK